MKTHDTLVADLIAAGVDPVLVMRVRLALEELEQLDRDAGILRARRAVDAAHKRDVRRRLQTRLQTSAEGATPSPVKGGSRPSPKFPWPADYREQFWNRYPRRVGKKAALTKLDNVRRADEVAFDALLAAVRRIDTKELQYVPHPATWLHQGRYLDAGPVPVDDEPVWRKPPPGMKSALNNGGGR
jgi:hypothetical protein